ncbi:MAG: coiled-coil domain-containing protein [Thermoproteota archaeon]
MTNRLNEKESKVLDYLKNLSKNGNKRIEFYINDAVNLTQIKKEEFEEALISLEEKGFLKIVKVPPSTNFLNLIEKKLLMLDATFLTEQISREEYAKRWEEIISSISDSKISHKYTPLSSIEIPDLIEGLSNTLEYLEKLKHEGMGTTEEIYKKLIRDYNEELHEVTNTILRYISSIAFAVEINKKVIETEMKKIEMIEIDERIRKTNRSNEKNIGIKNITKAKNAIEVISNKIARSEDESLKEKINALKNDLKKLREEYEVMRVKAMIEDNEALKKSADDLHNDILKKQKSLDELEEALKRKQQKGDVKRALEAISQKADSLFKDKLLTEEVMKEIIEIKTNLEKIMTEIDYLLQHINLGTK